MISKLLTIAANTFIESLRQPAFISILGAVSLLLAFNPAISILTLGEDEKLLIDLGLSTILLGGLFLSAFTATASISAETTIRPSWLSLPSRWRSRYSF